MSDKKKESNYENITVKELLSNLKVTQLWAVITIVFGLLAGSFTLGYKISQTLSNVHGVKSAELQKKDTFLSLYLRYELAKNNIEDDYSSYRKAREAFDEFIKRDVEAEKLILRKGEGRLATIQFSDGTVWRIPKELHAVEAQ